jgi:hypothetical protein
MNFSRFEKDFELKFKEASSVWKSMKFDGIWLEPQELIKFEQAHVCTWMIDQLMKRNLKIQICEFLDLLQEFDSNLFES